jgi:hypothetical protein
MEMAIKDRLTADVVFGKINQRVKYGNSRTAGVRARKRIFFFISIRFLIVLLMAKGLSTPKAKPTGGI